VVVPRFAVLLEGASKKLPLASQLLLGWGKSVPPSALFLGGFVCVSAAFVRHAARRAAAGSSKACSGPG